MSTTWQQQPPSSGQKVLDALRLAIRLPIVLVLLGLSVSSGAMGLALIVKSTVYVFEHVILKPW